MRPESLIARSKSRDLTTCQSLLECANTSSHHLGNESPNTEVVDRKVEEDCDKSRERMKRVAGCRSQKRPLCPTTRETVNPLNGYLNSVLSDMTS